MRIIDELDAESSSNDEMETISEEEDLEQKFEKIDFINDNYETEKEKLEKTIETIVDENLPIEKTKKIKKSVSFSEKLEDTYLFKENDDENSNKSTKINNLDVLNGEKSVG